MALLLAGAVAGYVAWRRATEPRRAWAEFLELEGKDLRTLPADERRRARELILMHFDFHLWNQTIVFDPCAIVRVPSGEGSERVLTLWTEDAEGGAVVLWIAETTKRGRLGIAVHENARLEAGRGLFRREVTAGCLEIFVARQDGGRVRQIYAPHGLGWALVRTETPEGDAVGPRPVRWGMPGLGPWWAKGPSAEWAQTLQGSETIEILVRLSWLGMRPGPPEVEAARADPAVRAAVEALRASPNSWIREAAELALRP